MDLSPTESMLLLMEGIWVEESPRHRVHIADTILIRNDLPVKWLFTSKDGYVLRKGKQQLHAIDGIPWSFKRTLQRKYMSSVDARTKIARVWTLQQDNLREELLDEAQLSAKLKSPRHLESMFMIQLFLEGMAYQGCGIFQHQYVLSSTPDVSPRGSWELKVPPPPKGEAEYELTQRHASRLSVPTEIDAALRDISSKVVGWLETYSGFTVERALLTFTLTSSTVFVLTGLENIRLSNVPKAKQKAKVTMSSTRVRMQCVNPQRIQSRSRPSSAVPTSRTNASPTKGYTLLTESRRLKSDSLAALEVLRPLSSSLRRPSSAPLRRWATQPALDRNRDGQRTLRINEPLQTDHTLRYLKRATCEGDLCGTLMYLREPLEDDDDFAVQFRPSFKVVMKSILLCRAETAFTGHIFANDTSQIKAAEQTTMQEEVRVT